MPSSLPNWQPQLIAEKRDVKKIPFVELHDGRLQGVVSSGSDIKRVYVSYFEAKTMQYYCSTNNNRPCGGLRGAPCKHLQELLDEAITQYGFQEIVRFLKLPADQTEHARDILAQTKGVIKDPAGEVFARFLAYLQLLEYPTSVLPMTEMDWFIE